MDKQRKKRIKRYTAWGLFGALTVALACMPLLAAGREAEDAPQASILSGTAETGEISTFLAGGGTLTGETPVEVTIPDGVKLTGYLVENGQTVSEGDPIAAVDRVSVMTAITQVQQVLDTLSEEAEALRGETAPAEVTALAGGTVKAVYGEKGDSVRDVMLEHGALAALSLDGLMAVQIVRSTALAMGDAVTVTFPEGSETEGRVESNLDGILTVTLEDAGYAVDTEVTVTSEDGKRIGAGLLYIHSQWNAVAASGTISEIRVSVGDTVSPGKTLMKLTDTGPAAEYQQKLDQRREYEARMLELFRMYQTETVTAPCDGMVSGVDTEGAWLLRDGGSGWQVTLLANAPNGDDETAYVNYVGQVVSVGVDGLVLRMNPQALSITDYTDLSGVPMDTALMTQSAVYSAQAPVYALADGAWTQLDASAISEGDLLLFAGDADGNFVWVVRIAAGEMEPEPSEPEPSQPARPADPSGQEPEQTDPDRPSGSEGMGEPPGGSQETRLPSTGTAGGTGSTFGNAGGAAQGETEPDGLATVTVASVIPQEQMRVQVRIDELDISRISLGQTASVTVDALGGERFPAEVTAIAGQGENEGGNSKFTVELTLARSGDMLPGMQASVVFPLDTVSGCVCIPVAALNEDGGQTLVYTSWDPETGTLGDPVAVTVGLSDGETAGISAGLEAGTVFYYPYYDTLEPSWTPEKTPFFG